ncbi:MAG: YdjY domain-containing protein [Phycisphaerales bacterium]|nr:YdjY domain-containing protein [Phycisphaerales bacterium]
MTMHFGALFLVAVVSVVLSGCARQANSTVSASGSGARSSTGQLDEVPRVVQPFEGVTVHLQGDASRVEIAAKTCLDEGWLEQIACGPKTREHESLVVISAKPSQIHAALLWAGFEPGAPGKWTYENNTIGTIDPKGELLEVLVRYRQRDAHTAEHSIRRWIRDGSGGGQPFPDEPWVFGGSIIAPNTASMGPGEHYVADFTGSIIGLVTFGDEIIGFSRVLSDQADVQAPVWEVDSANVPPVGSDATLILKRYQKNQSRE